MSEYRDWRYELDKYIRQSEPSKAERSDAWKTAIGLQDVDGLKTSDYLLDTAKEHIEGNIDIVAAQKRIENYYIQKEIRINSEENTKEADIVSSRIAAMLGEKTFQLSPAEFKAIHKRLFSGIFEHAGQYRKYNVSKKEWVLNGDTVVYASFESIEPALDYDFQNEKSFDYSTLSVDDSIKHISKFASDIWQIHPFCEGNTRTTAVFIIKYLKTFGFNISNDMFSDNSWYFRNALVRANYNNLNAGITASSKYLDDFFYNLLLGKNNELKNRYLHIGYNAKSQSAKPAVSKCKNCTLEEIAILNELKANPKITQKDLAKKIGKSERTVKTRTVEMQEKGIIKRCNGKRNGAWEILINYK